MIGASASAVRVLVPHTIGTRAPAPGGRVQALEGRTMGTTWSVRVVASRDWRPAPVARAIQQVLDEVVAQMSPWEHGSNLSRFNRAAAGTWQTLPPDFFEVLVHALAVARDSGGAYDPTAGALVQVWGFGTTHRHDTPGFAPPGEAEIAAARACSGWQRLEVDPVNRRVRQPGGLQLDLCAIAKGHAVDRVAALLAGRFGLVDALVEVGGELRGDGLKPDGQPWWVALERAPRWGEGAPCDDGDHEAQPHTRIALHGLAVATSGDYRRFFRHGGVLYPHTIDPRSGRPLAHGVALVSVLHAQCRAADALSTALGVMGEGAAIEWAQARGIAALIVSRRADGSLHERATSAWMSLM